MEAQKTIKKEFSLEGKGLQTGRPVKAVFYPEKENEGIIFVRKDLKENPSVRLKDFSDLDTDRRSKIGSGGGHYVETVEHITAALWGAEVDNIKIELDSSEPPALDGSSLEFLEALKKSGVKEQNAPREFVEIKNPIWVEGEESFLGVFPSSAFRVSYVLEYPGRAIGRQFFSSSVTAEVFRKEIAPARTFCLKQEAEALLKRGYGKGADLSNTLVMDEKGPIDNVLRFPDEPVRHKVLDLIGDLYLLGKPIKGRVIAIRSGHRLNLELVKRIKGNI
ncbi:MAG: UDP-3-O-acyl-N-acetylglucosamine deacetylase [Candidatus Omnitrophota bacterium]